MHGEYRNVIRDKKHPYQWKRTEASVLEKQTGEKGIYFLKNLHYR